VNINGLYQSVINSIIKDMEAGTVPTRFVIAVLVTPPCTIASLIEVQASIYYPFFPLAFSCW